MSDHTLTILPGLPDAKTVSGKCTCQTRFNGASEAEVHEAYQAHLVGVGLADDEDDGHRQRWTEAQLDVIERWADNHRIARDIYEEDIKQEAFRDLLDDLFDAKLLAGS